MVPNRSIVQGSRESLFWALICAALLFTVVAHARAQEKVLDSLTYADGESPHAGLILDGKGNLYGTAEYGGAHGGGSVFELSHEENGDWTEKTIFSFGSYLGDSLKPLAGVVFDADGRLYGSTYSGGKHGNGSVFRLTPHATGRWTEEVLYSFYASTTDGLYPFGGVVRDAKGNIYGTTYAGGAHQGGTIYELIPKDTGEWTEKILHSFVDTDADGYQPLGNLVLDAKGNLYGTTNAGGEFDLGTAYELSHEAGGGWKEKLIYQFGNPLTGPWTPQAGLVFDSKGNLYGTTIFGGTPCHTCGTVYELSPGTGGKWTAKTLHSFSGGKTDGQDPQGSVIFDAQGNLYGTTYYGGAHLDGVAFELAPAAGGSWKEKVLHSFGATSNDSIKPIGGLVHDSAGNLYGTSSSGGENGEGTIFEIVDPNQTEAP